MKKSNYSKIYKKTKLFYENIGSIYCIVLKKEIVFNAVGWRHIVNKGYSGRLISDQIRRFRLLYFIEDVLIHSDANIRYVSNTRDGIVAHFWTITAWIKGKKIKVLLRRIGDGSIHFFSIMD